MNQLDLFAAAPVMARPVRPDTAMLLAMSDNAPPRFAKQATGAAAAALISDVMAMTARGMCLSRVKGHETAKRAAEIAIAGKHDLAIIGDETAAYDLCARLWHLRGQFDDGETACVYINLASGFDELGSAPMVCGIDDFEGFDGGETSAAIAERIAVARESLDSLALLPVDDHAQLLMAQATEAIGLDWDRQQAVHAVARTIAALAGESEVIRRIHIAEALSYVAVRR